MISITEEGRKTLEEVYQWLEAGAPHATSNGSAFTMEYWDQPIGEILEGASVYSDNVGACGTAMCIGGAIEQFSGVDAYEHILGVDGSDEDDKVIILQQLFHPDENGYEKGYYATPQQAAKVVRHFIDTGEVDWSKMND